MTAGMLRRAFMLFAGVGLFGVAVVALVKWLPEWFATDGLTGNDRAEELSRVRTALLAVAAGVLAGIGAFYTHRTFGLNRAGQMTERFTRAIDQLGSPQVDVRLGGIYGLERIARDSQQDHAQVIEVLTAFVREHAPSPADASAMAGDNTGHEPAADPQGFRRRGSVILHHVVDWLISAPPSMVATSHVDGGSTAPHAQDLRTDVQAALTVIGRRDPDQDAPGVTLNLRRTDLRGLDLSGAQLGSASLRASNLDDATLVGTNLAGALLAGATLRGAKLREADLRKAELTSADLTGAGLYKANLAEANLEDAVMRRAYLNNADLRDSDLYGADLRAARLERADLRHAWLVECDLREADFQGADLRQANLNRSNLNATTLWNADLRRAGLNETDLRHADLTGTELTGATYGDDTLWPEGSVPDREGARKESDRRSKWRRGPAFVPG